VRYEEKGKKRSQHQIQGTICQGGTRKPHFHSKTYRRRVRGFLRESELTPQTGSAEKRKGIKEHRQVVVPMSPFTKEKEDSFFNHHVKQRVSLMEGGEINSA